MPGTPKAELEHLDFAGSTLDVREQTVDSGSDVYGVIFMELPKGYTLDPTKSLDGAVNGILQKTHGKQLEGYTVDNETGHFSRQIKIEVPGGQLVEARIIVLPALMDNPTKLPGMTDLDWARSRKPITTAKIYEVMLTHRKLPKTTVLRFLRSFHLLVDNI